MKLLFVIPRLDTGGAQRLLADLLNVMADNPALEISVAVYQSVPGSPFERQIKADSHICFINLDTPLSSHLRVISRLRPLIRQADVCHVHLFPALYHAALAAAGLKTRMIFTEHSTYNRRRNHSYIRLFERFVYSRYHVVAAISEAARRNLLTWLGAERSDPRFRVVSNGVNLRRFSSPAPAPEELPRLRQHLFGREGFPVLMISRFVESKDHPTFIRAISLIPDKRIFGVFIGDGPRRPEFESLAKELGVADRILFSGEKADIEKYIRAAAIGVQSSNWEGFGLTVVEMMAGGLPVIVSDVSGMADLVGDSGLTFRRGDASALADAILSLTPGTPGFNAAKAPALTAKAIEKARLFDISRTAATYLTLYTPGS